MKQLKKRHEITTKSVVYEIVGMDLVDVQQHVVYREHEHEHESEPVSLDVYCPTQLAAGRSVPAVVFVTGFPDTWFETNVGCPFKEMAGYISWCRILAASGIAAILYSCRDPVADLDAVLAYLRTHAMALGIDPLRVGIWAGSGNVPAALGVLMANADARVRCAVLCYGIMLDVAGTSTIAEAARSLGFANPTAGKSVADLPAHVPLMLVRAGRDVTPGLNEAFDDFAVQAVKRNLPLTLVNHATAPHAFDIIDDSEASREVIRNIVGFYRFHLLT